ncbi:hypothetical protein L9F63_005778 [Diploptera punctata]|uniref:Uncharacterized protein n=1 Tax=Diploptera punctata TaxID=6984 RepID=A0AAD8E547_DIPPU|nr:hypothetical protein L9F63_005778 [Diploptera punctata]
MNYFRLQILRNFIHQRTSYLQILNKKYTAVNGNINRFIRDYKWHSRTDNYSEIKRNESKNESHSSFETSRNRNRKTIGTDTCVNIKHQGISDGDPPLTLSVRPYPKSTTKIKDVQNNRTLKSGFQQSIMRIPNEILSMYKKWLQDRKSVEITWDSYFQHILLCSLRGLQELPVKSVSQTEGASKMSKLSSNNQSLNEPEQKSEKVEDTCEISKSKVKYAISVIIKEKPTFSTANQCFS